MGIAPAGTTPFVTARSGAAERGANTIFLTVHPPSEEPHAS